VEVSDIERTQVATPVAGETASDTAASYELCDHCGAPVDNAQRYCVSCGTRRRHVRDPAARYLAAAGSKSRPAAGRAPAVRRPASSLGLALILAVIPLAVGLGVLLGRSSTNGDAKLIAALRAQKPEVVASSGDANTGTTTSSGGSANAVAAVTSNFPLQSGYTVELETLSAHQTTLAAVGKAEQTARAKGAKNVGVILESDFTLAPKPPAGAAVIYAGVFRTRSEAEQELSKLRAHFPGAKVLTVGTSATATASGKVLSKTAYGSAQQITGFKASPSQLAQGKQIVDKVAKSINGSYVNSQKGLPDQISVP
jgi:hypothetical protein